jgi:TonB-dependent SusC/RagA subfamily outer membrane receptor
MLHENKCVIILILLFSSFLALAQNKNVTGKIVAFNTYPLNKTEVTVKSTKEVVYTDSLGIFKLTCKLNDKLIIKAKGFIKQTVNIEDYPDSVLVNLIFAGGEKNIQIATGYGYIDKDKLTYSISHLSEENFKSEYYATIFDMIKSKVPGVNVSSSGITIRGTSTFGDNVPLYVVDGFVTDFNVFKNIDPQSVKSVDLLKDAAASARYGSRGMNGVIVVTLKH